MIRIAYTACLCLALASLGAADWYVAPAPAGDDAHAGSQAAPLATLAGAIGRSGNGDRILLERGGTWRQSGVTVPAGRQVLAYGSGAAPVLTASATVSGFTPWAGDTAVSVAAVAAQVRACWVDGKFMHLARYPDSGWLTCDAGTTADAITDAALQNQPAGRWNGAQVRWRRWSWFWETRPIVSSSSTASGGTLVLGSANKTGVPDTGIGSAYFIDNDLDALDAPGEWFWSGGTLYVYPPAGSDPATMRVEVVTTTAGLTASGATFDGISFQRFGGTALTLADAACTVRACEFAEIEDTAIAGSWNAGGSLVSGCTIHDVRNLGVSWVENPAGPGGSVIERCQLRSIGMDFGYGGSGTWHAAGMVIINARNLDVRLDQFIDIGYCGVIVGVAGQTIERNVFVRCLGSLNDGAAIYTNCDATTIRENVVLDTIGNLETSHPWWPLGNGIWPEFLSNFKDTRIIDNTVYGCNGDGIFLENNYTCTISGNVCLDNRNAALQLAENDTATPSTSQGHVLTGNILGVVTPTRRLALVENLQYPGSVVAPRCLDYETGIDYGAMSGTTFIAPAGQLLVRTSSGTSQDLPTWKAANPAWADPGATLVAKNAVLLINDTEATAAIAVPAGSWTLHDGSAVGATVAVAPFHSAVLVTSGAVAATPPYYTASGTDYRAGSGVGGPPVAPGIVVQPADRTVTAGQTAGFTVAASGSAPLAYQWRRNGTDIPGATASAYTTPAASLADSGAHYSVVVTNLAGSATSAGAVLTVDPAPPGGGGGGSGGGGGGGGGCGLGGAVAALALALGLTLRRRGR